MDVLMIVALSEAARQRRAEQPLTGWEEDRLWAQRRADAHAATAVAGAAAASATPTSTPTIHAA